MRVLGLDPSLTNFGWAIHDTNAVGVERCPAKGRFQTSARTLYVARYMDLRNRVLDLFDEKQPDAVSLESSVFGELYSEGMYGLFLYISEACYMRGVDLVLFTPPQLKAHARLSLARPNVGGKKWVMFKGDMSEAAREHCGGTGRVWSNDEADAYWAAVAGARFWLLVGGHIEERDLNSVERQQFLKSHTFKRGKKAGKTIKSGIMFREDERFFQWSHDSEEK